MYRIANERNKYQPFIGGSSLKNSKIIDVNRVQELLELCNISSDQLWKLIYRGSEHGFGAGDFHSKCDNVPNTLTVVKSTSGHIFGGYANATWDQSNKYKNDPGAFLFSLVNAQNKRIKFKVNDSHSAIYCNAAYGPTFGNSFDLHITHNSNVKNAKNYSQLGNSYVIMTHTEEIDPSSDQRNKFQHFTEAKNFVVSEIEIYEIF